MYKLRNWLKRNFLQFLCNWLSLGPHSPLIDISRHFNFEIAIYEIYFSRETHTTLRPQNKVLPDFITPVWYIIRQIEFCWKLMNLFCRKVYIVLWYLLLLLQQNKGHWNLDEKCLAINRIKATILQYIQSTCTENILTRSGGWFAFRTTAIDLCAFASGYEPRNSQKPGSYFLVYQNK